MLLAILCLVVVSVAVSVKLLLTRGALLPGFDGAYYWVQVRSILTRGELAFPDLPLVLWMQAALAGIVDDVPLAVRISDAVLPALSVIPLAILMKDAVPKWMIPVVLFAVVLHPVQLFFYTGDFIKNEAAVPLVFVLGLLLARWRSDRKWAFVVGIVVTLSLIAISHFGTLLLSLTMTVLWVVIKTGRRSWRFWLVSAVSVLAGCAVVLILLNSLVPDRFDRLLGILGNPASLFENPIWKDIRVGYFRPAILFAIVSGQLMAVTLGIVTWRVRNTLAPSVRAPLVAFIVTAFLSSSPFIGAHWADRLVALSFVPLWLAGILLWVTTPAKSARLALLAMSGLTFIGVAAISPLGPSPQLLDEKRLKDFTAISQTVVLERPSLVVTSHGLDYLAAWQLSTDVADSQFFTMANDGGPYSSVYFIHRAYENPTGEVVYANDSFVVTQIK